MLIKEMDVAGGNGHLAEPVRAGNDALVYMDQVFFGSDFSVNIFSFLAFFGEYVFLVAGA